jgi:hypothetical protein
VLKISRIILSVIVVLISGYILITQNFDLNPLMGLFIAGLLLVVGISEFQKEQKLYGYLLIIVTLFVLFVSIQGFLLS